MHSCGMFRDTSEKMLLRVCALPVSRAFPKPIMIKVSGRLGLLETRFSMIDT